MLLLVGQLDYWLANFIHRYALSYCLMCYTSYLSIMAARYLSLHRREFELLKHLLRL